MSSVCLKHRKVCTHLHGLLNTLTQAKRGLERREAGIEEAQKNTGGTGDIRAGGKGRVEEFHNGEQRIC